MSDFSQWLKNIGASEENSIFPEKIKSFYDKSLQPRNVSHVGLLAKPSEEHVGGYQLSIIVLWPEEINSSLDQSILVNDVIDEFVKTVQMPFKSRIISAHISFVDPNNLRGSFEDTLKSSKIEDYIGIITPNNL